MFVSWKVYIHFEKVHFETEGQVVMTLAIAKTPYLLLFYTFTLPWPERLKQQLLMSLLFKMQNTAK